MSIEHAPLVTLRNEGVTQKVSNRHIDILSPTHFLTDLRANEDVTYSYVRTMSYTHETSQGYISRFLGIPSLIAEFVYNTLKSVAGN